MIIHDLDWKTKSENSESTGSRVHRNAMFRAFAYRTSVLEWHRERIDSKRRRFLGETITRCRLHYLRWCIGWEQLADTYARDTIR